MPKTLTQMKKRLEEAMNEVHEAEEIIPLIKAVIARFELVPDDLFDTSTSESRVAIRKMSRVDPPSSGEASMYRDALGNTWAGKGRRPKWLSEALEQGKRLEDFMPRKSHLRNAK